MKEKTLEVGDKILIQNPFMKKVVVIERVTKTKAISKPYNETGAVYEFKRVYYEATNIKPFSPVAWDTTHRTLLKPL
jgi:hypothetical protein